MLPIHDLKYLLRRAEQEAITAIAAENTPGNPAHAELSRRYSALAIRALAARTGRAPAARENHGGGHVEVELPING